MKTHVGSGLLPRRRVSARRIYVLTPSFLVRRRTLSRKCVSKRRNPYKSGSLQKSACLFPPSASIPCEPAFSFNNAVAVGKR